MTLILSIEFTQEEAVEIDRYAVNHNYEDAIDLIRQSVLYHVRGRWPGVEEALHKHAPERAP